MLLRILPSSEKRLIKLFHVYFKIAIFRIQISNVIFLYKLVYHFYFSFTLTCNLYKYYVVSLCKGQSYLTFSGNKDTNKVNTMSC